MTEWTKMAAWIHDHKVISHNVRWMIQIPRLYAVYRNAGVLTDFQNMIDNIFLPLFEVTINPQKDPSLYQILFQIVGFDTVDDESIYMH